MNPIMVKFNGSDMDYPIEFLGDVFSLLQKMDNVKRRQLVGMCQMKIKNPKYSETQAKIVQIISKTNTENECFKVMTLSDIDNIARAIKDIINSSGDNKKIFA